MGETKHDGLAIPGRVVLAHEPPFMLGFVHVDPPARQVERGGNGETLEPRVMQVLVALGRASGTIVTRDELIGRCWDGRIVTDDAINRVLSRIRHVAEGIGGGSFHLETITKVGYRLIERDRRQVARPPSVDVHRPALLVGRRQAIAAGATLAVAGAGALLWRRPWRHRPAPEARDFFRRGDLAQRVGTPDQSRQSVTFFERAVRIDPLYAEAWGALALAYTHNLEGYGESELASLPPRIKSAAQRALDLDPDNADAQLAVISIKPTFRNWGEVEPQLRRFCQRFPRHWLAHGRLALLLYQVGRLDDGIAFHQKVIAIDPMIAGSYAFLARALSNAGRIQEADSVLRQAQDRWPAHPLLWFTKYDHLLFSGRPRAASAFVMDPDALPSGFGSQQVEPRLALARAVESNRAADVESSIAHHRKLALEDPTRIPEAVPIFALLGRLDLTFASLDRYLLNQGSFGALAPIGPLTRRRTDELFAHSMAAARADPRFGELTTAIGLNAYWRSVGMIRPHIRH